MSEPRLCIFARVPALGAVKGRLAASLGAEGALRAHDMLVRDTLARLAELPGVRSELWLDGRPNALAQDWLRRHPIPWRRQQGEDLGARMSHALRTGTEAGGVALVVGADCPTVDADYVAAAVAELSGCDVVLGPAEDGGYALIGIRPSALGMLDRLFRGMVWGTDRVLADTLARAEGAALTVALLEPVWDVDEVDDWERFLALRGAPGSSRNE